MIPTTISTAQYAYPNDSATVSSTVASKNLPAGGTVVFSLYDTLANCQTGGATGRLYTQTVNNVGGQHSVTVGTTNTTVSVNTNTTVYWKVTYATGNRRTPDARATAPRTPCSRSTTTAARERFPLIAVVDELI